jgi:hypothetical protein
MTKQIPLKSRTGIVRAYTIVDEEWYEWLSQWNWRLCTDGYAKRGERPGGRAGRFMNIYMAREILHLPYGDPRMPDHINMNRLDNRSCNLRIAMRGALDNQQNLGVRTNNRSGYRGVSWDRRSGRWRAYATLNRKQHSMGYFDNLEDANFAVSQWRLTNMPFSQETTKLEGQQ